jgi:predicted transcriptional regulator
MNSNNNSSNTQGRLVLSPESVANSSLEVRDVRPVRRASRSNKGIQNAVYAHIQAIRALGRKEINTAEIADALSLPVSEVNRAISALKRKGVKALNG